LYSLFGFFIFGNFFSFKIISLYFPFLVSFEAYLSVYPIVGGERARERASEKGRRDVSGRGEQEENVCTAKRPPSWLLRAASKSSGWVSALAALPYPAPALPNL